MTKQFCVIAFALWIGAGSADDLIGCGDKFLSAARGTRFQRAPQGRQEAILIYANPQSELPSAMARVSVESALVAAGYRPMIVTTAAELERELAGRAWDLLLCGLSDAEKVSAYPLANAGILPVILKGAKDHVRSAASRYPVVLTKAPSSQGLVRAVAQALASRTGVNSD